MVNNQIEFNEKFLKQETREIEIKRNRNFQGHLVVEDYSELEKLNLRDVKNIDKIVLKNLTRLQECIIWNCGLKDLEIENCPQIKRLNVRRNLLTNLEFLRDLDNLEELELDGNTKLSEILEPYEDDWKTYQSDLQKANKNINALELLENIKVLKKEKEFLSIKYDELKKFLKEILVSLSQEEKKGLSVELDKKIKRKDSISAPGRTKELILNTEKVVKGLKEIKKELENELVESKTKIEDLEKELKEKNELYQEKEIELKLKQKEADNLLNKLLEKSTEKGQVIDKKEKENLQKEIDDLRKKLNETKEREFELKGELKAKREEIERMNKTIDKAIDTPKVQNIQNAVFGSQSINTYQIQYNVQYQQLETETENQISKFLSDKEIIVTLQDQKIINKTILFLGTKELFINHRQATINNLIDCYNKLEKRLESKLNKFTNAVSMTNIAGKLASIIPGGGVAEVPVGIVGDVINLTGTIIKGKDLEKFTKQFQEILAQDKKNLSLFDGNYLSLVNTVWEDNKASQGEIVSTIINTLNLVKTELSPFSNDHNAFSQSISGTWQGRSSLELDEMKSSIEAIINNFQELKQRLQNEKEQLSKQAWFKAIETKTDLLQEQLQTQIQINPK